MNREQAREIAYEAVQRAAGAGHILSTGEAVKCGADALHAAYEAERGAVPSAARLASIKETARRIWASNFIGEAGDAPFARWYNFAGGEDLLTSDCDAAVRFAEALESAFERRYGGKP